ncbi:3779_t:CDS:10 [Funneliformis mosseae]|uniref:3779_t:CDS:1 n=1 Tax=Funneliformis mosseae TaxID=27381 RepID=A0A9N8YRL8_FUNMO|nr:3779_t:CDS:10 [Funneliformis mosseae]
MGEGGILSGEIPTAYNPENPIPLFVLQVILIITLTRLLNVALSHFRQPRVISEVIGGIILGPSVFGQIPGYMDTIFPEESRSMLHLAATFGLVFFLFLIGVEMNPRSIINNARAAISISFGGIITCFALGSAVGFGLYSQFTDKTAKFSSFILFIGVAMSITAFPVLARILSELQLIRTPVGIAALTASVNDDVVSWILLALVISLIHSTDNLSALYVFLLCIAWILVIVFIVRPILLKIIVKTGSNDNGPTLIMMAITLGSVLASAFVTSVIGVHAIFGGFIMGVIIPHEGGFAVRITEKIEDLINVLFLPIYFTLSGLKTNLSLLNDGRVWLWVIIVITCAMMGKIFGAGLMARFNGFQWREALTIGVLMSCKGLVELIVLNIGYDAGIIDDRIFVIMVTMAIFTTFTTSPLATWIYSSEYQKKMEMKRTEQEPSVEKRLPKVSGETLFDKHRNLLVVLNQAEWLPAMMTLIQLLQPTKSTVRTTNNREDEEQEIGTSTTPQINSPTVVDQSRNQPFIVHALRIIELTQRLSTVMKFNETEETMLHDPIMNIFRMFGYLNFVYIKANLSVVPIQNFAQEVAENIKETGSDMVIIPWNGAGTIIDDPANSIEERIEYSEKKDTSPQVAQFAQGVFDDVNVTVGFLIDRGLGVDIPKADHMLSNGTSIHIYLPFFGGVDDREALSFVVRLLNHPHVTATVERIMKSSEPTDNDTTLKRTDLLVNKFNVYDDVESDVQRPPLAHQISTASNYILNSNFDRQISDETDDSLLSELFKVGTGLLINNSKISYREMSSGTPLQTAIEHGKGMVTKKDLVVVGRGRRDAIINHRKEFIELLKNLGLSYGNNTRKCLGDIAEAFLVSQISSSQVNDDHISSITQLWTLPRTTLLLITPILTSTTLQISPRYIEPIYGNVFSSIYFSQAASASILLGIAIGIGFVVKSKELSPTIKDQKLAKTLIFGIDLCGIILALSPLSIKMLFGLSDILGPYIGPHVTQLGLAYPTMLLLGFLNTIACARLSREQNLPTLRWFLYVAIHITIIKTLTYVLYNVVDMGQTCHRLCYSGLIMALIGTLFKFLLQNYGEINLVEDVIQRRKILVETTLSFKIRSASFLLLPQIIIVFLVIYNANFNPHCNSGILQKTIVNGTEYTILARNESVTGWVEVVEEIKPRNIRVMRVGHSLIGGIYRDTNDSVFGSFYFLEAVRLIENQKNAEQERALQIGLGIGVSAKSLQDHNVLLDIVELDPVVYNLAVNYFGLERRHNIYIQDGRKFINNAPSRYYDYVLHDVFTGGSVPSVLFSIEALEQIKRILKKNGVLALNFVGSDKWPQAESLALVANTIKSVFPYYKCFREGPLEKGSFQNMVFFASVRPISFRNPTEEDFMDSAMREYMLESFTQWSVDLTKFKNVSDIITDLRNPLNELQQLSAFEHWNIMRTIFPQEFWINF